MNGFLTTSDISLFHAQGYVLKQNCISKEEMAIVKSTLVSLMDRVTRELSQTEYEPTGKDHFTLIDGSRIHFKPYSNSISIQKINGCCGVQPSLLETVRSNKMVHTFFELLGTNDLEHIIAQLHPKLPGDGIAYPRHQDLTFRKSYDKEWKDVLGNGSYGVCIIPVDSMSPENGGLWVDKNFNKTQAGDESQKEDRTWIYAEPGDLLFMHPNLYHGSEANNSSVSRMTLLSGFCAFGANSKPYPGALVNVRLTLREDKGIATAQTAWGQTTFTGPSIGH